NAPVHASAVTLTAFGSISQTAAGAVTADSLVASTVRVVPLPAPTITLAQGNSVASVTLTSFSAAQLQLSAGDITFFDNAALTIAGLPGGGGNGLQTGIATLGNVTLQSGGAIGESGAVTAAALVARTTTGGAITLARPANAVGGDVTLTVLNGSALGAG